MDTPVSVDYAHFVLAALTVLGFLAAFLKSVGLNEVAAQVTEGFAQEHIKHASLRR